MATPHMCRSNPDFFFGGSSCIHTVLDELPNEISPFLNIPDTLLITLSSPTRVEVELGLGCGWAVTEAFGQS